MKWRAESVDDLILRLSAVMTTASFAELDEGHAELIARLRSGEVFSNPDAARILATMRREFERRVSRIC